MNPIQARLISMSKDEKSAQVIVYLGEGQQRRSVTRHIRLGVKGAIWGTGRNPDEAAVAKLDAAEKILGETLRQHDSIEGLAKISVKEINEILESIRRFGENSGVPSVFLETVKVLTDAKQELNAEAVKAFLKRKVARSAAILRITTKQTEELRKSIPREVEFKF